MRAGIFRFRNGHIRVGAHASGDTFTNSLERSRVMISVVIVVVVVNTELPLLLRMLT